MSDIDFQNRTHFFALAARQMRRILVEHARNRAAVKRAGAPARITLSDADASVDPRNEDVLAVDLALDELEKQDRRAAMIVEFKFFGGLKDNEIADTLDIPFATVRRDWEFARAWLLHRLSGAKSAHAT